MSKATSQTILLLSIVYGGLNLLIADNFDQNEKIGSTLLYSKELAQKIIDDYAETGNRSKNYKWIETKHNEWKSNFDEKTIFWPPVTNITMLQSIIDDLMVVISNNEKRNALQPLADCIHAMAREIEAENLEEEYKLMSLAGELIDKLYKTLDFPMK